ncbi:hypothetical protein KQX54_018174 [Cotesia glomerata]|uniref:Uncharacterized protein n=1 Tax=Cotesia glomerata TaxID=32391 RepID=A0AAV7HVF7_COTGL|nr:hypothetical protein KQX54_018174 [Cotesia glomerata]
MGIFFPSVIIPGTLGNYWVWVTQSTEKIYSRISPVLSVRDPESTLESTLATRLMSDTSAPCIINPQTTRCRELRYSTEFLYAASTLLRNMTQEYVRLSLL